MQFAKRPTYADVAREAGVSQTTVSFVMNGRGAEMSIPQATCDKVLAAAATLGYRPNRLASGLASGKTSTLGVVVPRLESTFFSNIVHGIQEVADEHGCRILLGYSRHDPKREASQVDLLLEHRVDGVICLADEHTAGSLSTWLDTVVSQRVPIVIVDEGSSEGIADCVVPDDATAGAAVMRHLIENGHRRIAHVVGPIGRSTSRDRLAAYKGALVSARIPFDQRYVVGERARHEELAPLLRELLTYPERPTAIFAANDVRAARVVEVMRGMNLSHPEDVEVVGFGNLELTRTLGISTVDQDPKEMGRLAAMQIFERIQTPSAPPKVIHSTTKLLLRDGVGSIDYSLA